ncbi:hypothetical protein M569_10062 [Genlisea aurea]|uniref:Uncharacterized protein n=1 Tax=Genlisea aurea TaxID=192259 RepID=S8CCN1_9LAMI|nr:hypothetical protein M569_10062 [Genlisea aurea]
MMAARNLSSSSTLKKLIAPFSSYSLRRRRIVTVPPSSTAIEPLPPPPPPPFLRSNLVSTSRDGNYDEKSSLPVCPGCGIRTQNSDPKQPGYFIHPSPKPPDYKRFKRMIIIAPVSDQSQASRLLKTAAGLQKIEDDDRKVFDEMPPKPQPPPTVCSRCHSLRHYRRVKDPAVENLLPDFDFDHTVGRRLSSAGGARTVILLLADAADFDGSFPRRAAASIFDAVRENSSSWKEGKSGNVPRVLLILTKIDLLPHRSGNVSPTRLDHWVRTRGREGGAAGKLAGVHLVSAPKGWGIKTLVDDVVRLSGERGNVWVLGAQNAGKSTLINAMAKSLDTTTKTTHLTEASVPGTTLGILRMEGVLPGKAKLFDTPGLLHPHQISTRLTAEERKLVSIDKELKPRTYRIRVDHSVHIGGLVRLDLEASAVDSVYVTVWASPLIPLHMGRTENAAVMSRQHFGRQLQPPIGEGRVEEMGKWVKKEFDIKGERWDSSSVDVAVAGVGWFAIGLKGGCRVSVWTYEGVDVVARNSLLPQRSNRFEVAGFTVNEIVSKADRATSKKQKLSPCPL